MNVDAYLRHLQALLPPGIAWTREPNAVLTLLLQSLADGYAEVDADAIALVEESDPLTTNQLLADWERVLGLPESCDADIVQTTSERLFAVHMKLTTEGGQSPQFFIKLAERLGYTITITEFDSFRVGYSEVGDALSNDAWAFVWQVNAAEDNIKDFSVGQSSVGDPLRSWGNDLLECIIRKYKPAHTKVLFAYT